jgi:DNA-binding response OmpR family regulator
MPTPKTILVVDDETQLLKMFTIVLSREGYHVDTASNVEAAISKIDSNEYDLIITDIKMPEFSGEDLATYCKTEKSDKKIPLIGMSGTPWLIDHDLFEVALPKPFYREELFEALKRVETSYR